MKGKSVAAATRCTRTKTGRARPGKPTRRRLADDLPMTYRARFARVRRRFTRCRRKRNATACRLRGMTSKRKATESVEDVRALQSRALTPFGIGQHRADAGGHFGGDLFNWAAFVALPKARGAVFARRQHCLAFCGEARVADPAVMPAQSPPLAGSACGPWAGCKRARHIDQLEHAGQTMLGNHNVQDVNAAAVCALIAVA